MTTIDPATPQSLFPQVGDGSFLEQQSRFLPEEVNLALRNHAMPLEALRYDDTPTGMHYTLVHYDVPVADAETWGLKLDLPGCEATCTMAAISGMPAVTQRVTMECAGDGRGLTSPRSISQPWHYGAVGTASWTGVPLITLLELAGLNADQLDKRCGEIIFTGIDEGFEGGMRQRYQRSLPVPVALRREVMVAYAMNGSPLEPQHGFPIRLIVPGWYGMTNVKWLTSVSFVDGTFDGYQNSTAYRYSNSRDERGEAVSTMRVRSLMVPPGIPDYLTRTRVVPNGSVEIFGRAWSGEANIARVEFSDDCGTTWQETQLGQATDPYAWVSWRYMWKASPGKHLLTCRASDAAGNVQPESQFWTARGMGNNVAQTVPVIVEQRF